MPRTTPTTTLATRARALALALALALAGLAGAASPAAAAPGDLDPSFGTGGTVTDGGMSLAADTVVQADGKTVVAGAAGNAVALSRFNADGTPDTGFGTAGRVVTDFPGGSTDHAESVALQADGRIVVAGSTTAAGRDVILARYTASGALDTGFGAGGMVVSDLGTDDDQAMAVGVLPDGRVVVAGFVHPGGAPGYDMVVARYTSGGALDPTFGTAGRTVTDFGTADDEANALAVQPDGRVVVAGSAYVGGTSFDFALARYTTGGALDPTFGSGGKLTVVGGSLNEEAFAVLVQPDGRVLAGGYATSNVSGPAVTSFGLIRLSPAGVPDPSFGFLNSMVRVDVGAGDDYLGDLALQADGRIVAFGTTDGPTGGFSVARLNTNGVPDSTFSGDGTLVTDLPGGDDVGLAGAMGPDGRLTAVGLVGSGIGLARYLGDPVVTVSDPQAVEGSSGAQSLTFTISISERPVPRAVLPYTTTDGTATAGDYVGKGGTITIPNSRMSFELTVDVLGDRTPEPNETVVLNLLAPTDTTTHVAVLDSQGVGTIVDDDTGPGYWLTASDGGMFSFGVPFHGSTGAQRLNQPIVGLAATPTGGGYWLVASDGGIFAFGDAAFLGSTGAIRLTRPIVGMAATPTGRGYWLVASDGGIFAFGDAPFAGSTGDKALNMPIVGMAATASGKGYRLVASDGGIFSFGDAVFLGSTGSTKLSRPIVGMTSTPTGRGYVLAASDGGIFTFGDAVFRGSTGDKVLNRPIVGMAGTGTGKGYWLVASDGGIFSFGDADFFGSTGAIRLNRPIIGMAARPFRLVS